MMISLGKLLVICTATLLIMVSVNATDLNQAYYRSFWFPDYYGKRLNYCSLGNKTCGLQVATRYCRLMGYDHADQQLIDYNVGLTHFMSSRAECKGWYCNGFKTIRCVAYMSHNPPKPPYYRLKRFVYPCYNRYRVDWCYDGQKGCGQVAARSFCRRMGYLKARGFAIQNQVVATKALRNQKPCLGKRCHGFEYISCYR